MKNKKYFIYESFITVEECKILYEWIEKNFSSDNFKKSVHTGTIRKTTRTKNKKIGYPSVAYEIQKRVEKKICEIFHLQEIKKVPAFIDGMYASYGLVGDKCEIHKDPVWLHGYATYHFNIILSDFEGAEIVIESEKIKLNKNDGLLYPVSHLEHGTMELIGKNPRLFWCFGFCVPIEKF